VMISLSVYIVVKGPSFFCVDQSQCFYSRKRTKIDHSEWFYSCKGPKFRSHPIVWVCNQVHLLTLFTNPCKKFIHFCQGNHKYLIFLDLAQVWFVFIICPQGIMNLLVSQHMIFLIQKETIGLVNPLSQGGWKTTKYLPKSFVLLKRPLS